MIQALPALSLQVRSPGLGDSQSVRQKQTWRATHKEKLYVCDRGGGVQHRKRENNRAGLWSSLLSVLARQPACGMPQSGGLAGSVCFFPSEAQQPGATSFPKAFLVP